MAALQVVKSQELIQVALDFLRADVPGGVAGDAQAYGVLNRLSEKGVCSTYTHGGEGGVG